MDVQIIRFLREKLRLLEREVNDPFGRDTGCCGLTLAQCHTLLEIGARGEVSLVDLASNFGLDTSTLSRMIQGLFVLGLVNRVTNEKDRRYVRISLTKAGRNLFDRIEETFNAFFSEVLKLIHPDKRESVIESIGLFSDAVRERNRSSTCCDPDAVLEEARKPGR